MIKMYAMPIYGKIIKNPIPYNTKNCDDPALYLTFFMARSV